MKIYWKTAAEVIKLQENLQMTLCMKWKELAFCKKVFFVTFMSWFCLRRCRLFGKVDVWLPRWWCSCTHGCLSRTGHFQGEIQEHWKESNGAHGNGLTLLWLSVCTYLFIDVFEPVSTVLVGGFGVIIAETQQSHAASGFQDPSCLCQKPRLIKPVRCWSCRQQVYRSIWKWKLLCCPLSANATDTIHNLPM